MGRRPQRSLDSVLDGVGDSPPTLAGSILSPLVAREKPLQEAFCGLDLCN